jgi:hypothetical protein
MKDIQKGAFPRPSYKTGGHEKGKDANHEVQPTFTMDPQQ